MLLRRRINQIEKAGITDLEFRWTTCLGRATAKAIVHPSTGEIIAECNTELTDDLLAKIAKAQVVRIEMLWVTYQ